ncbi:type III secretion protein [Pseudomonas sp. MWU16-30323]|uniref:tetratricopeptide repeat protein n=1 Tax=Pseudomonas sp. MWU16-30323 TaxID=2878094 RepID=UPI001CFC1D2D|nr:type III secretion protein [Pseudomonas sp. MWU16-30323]
MSRNNDDAVQLLKGIGELYRRNGQSQRALVMLLIAVSVAPDDGLLLRSLVLAFTDSGDFTRALAALDRLVVLEGESASLLLLRARALWYGERKDEARQCFKRYLAARRVAP